MAETSYSLSLLEGNVPRYASIDLQSGKAYTALFGLDITAEGELTGYGIGLSNSQSVASGTQYVIEYSSTSQQFYLATISTDENPGIQGPVDATAGYHVYGYTAGGSAGWTALPTGIPYLTSATTMKSLSAPSLSGSYVLLWNNSNSEYVLTNTTDAATITGIPDSPGSTQNCLLAKEGSQWAAISYPTTSGSYNLYYDSDSNLSLVATQSALPTVSFNLVIRESSDSRPSSDTWGCVSLSSSGTASTAVGCFAMSNEKQIQKGDYLVTLDIGYYLQNVSYEERQLVDDSTSGSAMCNLVDDQFEGVTSNSTYLFDIDLRFTPVSVSSTGAQGSNYVSFDESEQNENFYNYDTFWIDESGIKTIVGTTVIVPSGTPSLRYVTTSFYVNSSDFVGEGNMNYFTARLVLRKPASATTSAQTLCLSQFSTITFTPI